MPTQSSFAPSGSSAKWSPVSPVGLALLILLALVCVYAIVVAPGRPSGRLLLAPMIGQIEPCVRQTTLPPEHAIDPAFVACRSDSGSAAAVIDHTLSRLGSRISANGRYELGYTLNVPLLKFLVERNGQWELDQAAIDRTVKTITQSDRKLVLYLFSTHFSAFAPIEPLLAADPTNIAQSSLGPIPLGKHYGMDVYPWSIARTDNSLTRSRVRVIDAFAKALCEQPEAVRERIAAITVLGEVHHMFPDFEGGMGFGGKYLVSDYSPASVAGFRAFLEHRFRTVAALNAALDGARFANFSDVDPPAKDIRTEKLKHYWEHIDAYAAGRFPVQGWLAPHPDLTGEVQVLLNGKLIGSATTGLGRQDVLEHHPQLQSADVGWRFDVDFHNLKPGQYLVEIVASMKNGARHILGKRTVVVLDRSQVLTEPQLIQATSPFSRVNSVQASVDAPRNLSDYYFNPLAKLWLDFREQQVVRYLNEVVRPVGNSCLSGVPLYTHQLFPYPNSSWDSDKYAVGASLLNVGGLNLGVSLYGEATYGKSFFHWKQTYRPGFYGVTEFHPLRAMDAPELKGVLDNHRNSGAQFLSFFLEGRGPVNRPYSVKGETIPFLGESNTQNGSDQLYRSLQEVLAKP